MANPTTERRLAIGLLALLVTGCSVQQPPPQSIERSDPSVIQYSLSYNGAQEFRLKDGTRCVAMYRGGIDCEWGSHVH